MSTLNPFDLLGGDAEDPSQIVVSLPKKVEKEAPAQPAKGAKLQTKQPPTSQAVRESRNAPSGVRGGGAGRGPPRGSFNPGGDRPHDLKDGERTSGFRRYRESGGRGGQRGGPANGRAGDGRVFERRSGTGRGNDLKREGGGRGNWGTPEDDIPPPTEEATTEVEKSPVAEKEGGEDDTTDAKKDTPADEGKEKEPEDKEMTLEEYEKILEEKKKALQATKVEERKVDTKVFESMQQLSSKKTNNEEIFIKLGSDKDKRKDAAEKEEKAKKSLSINEFLKPADGERYNPRGGGYRGRGGRNGGRGQRDEKVNEGNVNDEFLERFDVSVDDFQRVRKEEEEIGRTLLPPASDFEDDGFQMVYGKKKKPVIGGSVIDVKLAERDNKSLSGKAKVPFHVPTIKKPQEEFNILVNNANQPFEHVWLERSEDNQRVLHPLEKLSVIDFVGNSVSEMEPVKPLPLEETPFKLVQDVKDLKDLVAKLRTVDEFAVDLEHNQYRSFQGLTCLMQISTRTEDYIVDTFKLRVHIGPYLREIFKDPKKRKVIHGADRDIVWLQRDFGIYVCNLFDTGQASRVLNLERNSLEFLLQHFCGVTANKEYQNADWRIRPLPKEMTRYAREDTHYLLYIYDVMRLELQRVAKADHQTDSPLLEVYKRSYDLCTQLYEKELLTENSYLHIYGLQAAGFNAAQLAIVAGLCEWRDYVARAEDESTGYVLPNKLLLEIAKEMPLSVAKLRRLLKSKHPYIERNVNSVVSLIKHSIQNCAAFESAALSLKDASPGTVMENIEPLSERKDMYTRTDDVASPNLKENSLHVQNNTSGLVMVAADASERKDLGTGLFGSAKGPAAVLISKKPSSGLGALLGSSASKKKFRTDKNVNEEAKLEQIRSSVNLQFQSFTDKSSESKSATGPSPKEPEEVSTTMPASVSKQHGATALKDDSEEASEIAGTSDRVSDAEVSCFETENVILLDDGGGKEVDAEDEPMSLSELSTNFQKCFNSMSKSNNKAQKPEFLNVEPFDYEAARKEVTFGEGQKGRQGGKKEGGSKAGGQKKGSAPEQSEFGQGKRRQAFPASGNRSATFKS